MFWPALLPSCHIFLEGPSTAFWIAENVWNVVRVLNNDQVFRETQPGCSALCVQEALLHALHRYWGFGRAGRDAGTFGSLLQMSPNLSLGNGENSGFYTTFSMFLLLGSCCLKMLMAHSFLFSSVDLLCVGPYWNIHIMWLRSMNGSLIAATYMLIDKSRVRDQVPNLFSLVFTIVSWDMLVLPKKI